MTVAWGNAYGYWLPPGRSVNGLRQQSAGGWDPCGAVLCRSRKPAHRKLGRDDRRLAVHELGIKKFSLQTTMEVISCGNAASRVTVDPSPMSVSTLLHGLQHGRE